MERKTWEWEEMRGRKSFLGNRQDHSDDTTLMADCEEELRAS